MSVPCDADHVEAVNSVEVQYMSLRKTQLINLNLYIPLSPSLFYVA